MNETTTIRKTIDGININTDTAHCIHTEERVVTEQVEGQLVHLYIINRLYKNQDGRYFVAFWNKPSWNNESFKYDFIDEVILLTHEQAHLWIMNKCPEKLEKSFWETGEDDNQQSTQTLTLRLNTDLRNHLASSAKFSGKSLNKLCIDYIRTGILVGNAHSLVTPPRPQTLTMPDGRPVLDLYEKALDFENEDEKQLAKCAENLYGLYRFNYQGLLPFIVHTLYRLTAIKKNEEHAICFAKWLAGFHRASWSDAMEFQKENQAKAK